jgi:hypothetical protein
VLFTLSSACTLLRCTTLSVVSCSIVKSLCCDLVHSVLCRIVRLWTVPFFAPSSCPCIVYLYTLCCVGSCASHPHRLHWFFASVCLTVLTVRSPWRFVLCVGHDVLSYCVPLCSVLLCLLYSFRHARRVVKVSALAPQLPVRDVSVGDDELHTSVFDGLRAVKVSPRSVLSVTDVDHSQL